MAIQKLNLLLDYSLGFHFWLF